MKTRTISVFRAHYNVRISNLAEKLNLSVDELTKLDEVTPVPQDVAEKIVEVYDLVPFYFTEDIEYDNKVKPLKKTPTNPFWYFFKISLIVFLVISFATGILTSIITFIAVSLNSFANIDTIAKISPFILNVFSIILGLGECIFVSKYILEHTTLAGKIDDYKFLWHILPTALLLLPNLLFNYLTQGVSLNLADAEFNIVSVIMLYALSFALSLVFIMVQAYIFVLAIEENDETRNRKMKLVSILSIVSYIVYYIVRVGFIPLADIQNWIASIITAVFTILTALGIIFKDKLGAKADKLIYTIFPIIAIVGSSVFKIIVSIFN